MQFSAVVNSTASINVFHTQRSVFHTDLLKERVNFMMLRDSMLANFSVKRLRGDTNIVK